MSRASERPAAPTPGSKQMDTTTTFTLRSTELRDYQTVHNCRVVTAVVETGATRLLVHVEPPIPGCIYNEPGEFDRVVLTHGMKASRSRHR